MAEEQKPKAVVEEQKKQVKRLYRSKKDKVLGGVCGGIAEYFGIDPVLVRVGWVLGTLISMGLGIIGYIVCWIIIPEKPE
ncbi:MAG: PspC domain-containing protein [Candidatus Thermoplasmatota archaeon]|nr:PspC domain-containing protein [Candidatus Thermoplasmatota archaeon]